MTEKNTEDIEKIEGAGEGEGNQEEQMTPEEYQAKIDELNGTIAQRDRDIATIKRKANKKKAKGDEADDAGKPASDAKSLQRMFLKRDGLTEEQIEFAEMVSEKKGIDLFEAIEDKMYQRFSETFKQEEDYQGSIPRPGKKGASTHSKDTVEYWVENGGLPKDRELRTKVVDARVKSEPVSKYHNS